MTSNNLKSLLKDFIQERKPDKSEREILRKFVEWVEEKTRPVFMKSVDTRGEPGMRTFGGG